MYPTIRQKNLASRTLCLTCRGRFMWKLVEAAAKWGQVTVDGHSAPPAGKSTRRRDAELAVVSGIGTPVSVLTADASQRAGQAG